MKPSSASGPVTILRDCLHSLQEVCGGPVEQGGLLLGTCSGSGSLIYSARPLPWALRTSRSFHPPRWRPLSGLRRDVLGWFHTHPGGGLHLSRADARVHRRLFPRGDGLALVVRFASQIETATVGLALYGGVPLRAVETLRVA